MPVSRFVFGNLPWYSVLIVTGICLAIWLATMEERRLQLPKDTVIDLALFLVPMGILGARLYYVAFSWEAYRHDLLSIFAVWNGGLAIYGGILGGALAGILFAWKRKISVLTLFDMIVPGLALAQAIGRWGNFFNMEAYGAPITHSAWQFFPVGVLIPENGGQVWYMATFFYESVWNLIVFITLWTFRKKTKQRGDLFCWYALLYGAGRFVIEGLRMDSLFTAGGSFRISQMLSLVACLVVLIVFTIRKAQKQHTGLTAIAVLTGFALSFLPAPREPFFGANVCWGILCCLACVEIVVSWKQSGNIRRVGRMLVFAVCVLGRSVLSAVEMSELTRATMTCVLYSALTISSAIGLY